MVLVRYFLRLFQRKHKINARIKINSKTKYIELLPIEDLITDETKEKIKKGSIEIYGEYMEMKLKRFFELINEEYYKTINYNEITVFEYYWILGFKDFIEEFIKILKNFEIKETPEENQAGKFCYESTFQESILIFTRNYFNLPSFEAVGELSLGEYLIARKDNYNKIMFEKSYNKIIMTKK